MKKVPAFLALLLSSIACAQLVLRVDNATIGPITSINCEKDGGLSCQRDAGAVAFMSCAVGGTSTRGCIEPGTAQTFSGPKTFTGLFSATGGVDAGFLNTPDYHVEGSVLQCTDSTNVMILQSNVPDSLTSTVTPAMRFYLSQALAGGDLGWCFTDSTGTDRMCGTANGTWNFASHVTSAGTATVAGTNFSSAPGAGGASSGATPGGTGGAWTMIAGAGGDSAGAAVGGNGGAISITAGAGGALNGSQAGGAGGALTLKAGASKPGAAAGGTTTVAGGPGANLSGSQPPAAGGPVSVSGGLGGRTSSGTSASGGAVTVSGGVGGDGVSGTAGVGGDLVLTGGNAGAVGVTGATGGAVTLDTGSSSGAAGSGSTNPAINIGTTNAVNVTIGRSGKVVVVNGLTQFNSPWAFGAAGTSLSDSRALTAQNINFGLIAAQTCVDNTIAVGGVQVDDPVACSWPAALLTGLAGTCWVSAAGTVKFRLCNVTTGGITQGVAAYGARTIHT